MKVRVPREGNGKERRDHLSCFSTVPKREGPAFSWGYKYPPLPHFFLFFFFPLHLPSFSFSPPPTFHHVTHPTWIIHQVFHHDLLSAITSLSPLFFLSSFDKTLTMPTHLDASGPRHINNHHMTGKLCLPLLTSFLHFNLHHLKTHHPHDNMLLASWPSTWPLCFTIHRRRLHATHASGLHYAASHHLAASVTSSWLTGKSCLPSSLQHTYIISRPIKHTTTCYFYASLATCLAPCCPSSPTSCDSNIRSLPCCLP